MTFLMTSTTAPQRGVFASFAFLLISMLSAQALAFDVGGFSYTNIIRTFVQVDGCDVVPCAVKDIVIPATVVDSGTTYSVTLIASQAFDGNALTSVIIPDTVQTIATAAFQNNALTSVIIPDSVTSIGQGAFDGNALTSVIIGNSVRAIGAGAFAENALTSVIIPDTVQIIGTVAFGRNALTSAAFLGNYETFDLNMFQPNANLATITYCEGTTGWPQDFDNGSTVITTTSIACGAVVATPVPTSPIWLLGIMAGLLSLVGMRKLCKT
jgi:hypothetical protein